MKKFILSAVAVLGTVAAMAQANDPIVMTINGVDVPRSEFEYSYNKNNSEGVIDKKTVKEYVDLFVNYKMKVLAAQDAQLDTLTSYQKEFASYRDQQIRPAMITDADVEAKAHQIYTEAQQRIDGNGGLVKPAHILIMVPQTATDAQLAAAKTTADSLYNVLKAANFDQELFGKLAEQYSKDPGSARQGGELPFIQQGQTYPEFNDKIFAMQIGETCEPVKTVVGFHIIQMRDRGTFLEKMPYDSQREAIAQFIEQRGIRNQIIDEKLDSIANVRGTSADEVLAEKREEMAAADPELKYLIQEYHDGLLLYEISSRTVWDKAAKDDAGLAKFFKKNKKKYTWDEPRFKGMAFRTRNIEDVEAVKASVKKLKFEDWNETLRTTFNNDSVLRIRVEKGIFKKGDNAIIDTYEFNTPATIKEMKDYPNTASFGKMLKKPENYLDVKGLVVSDYQESLEKAWVAELRKKYTVKVYDDVLKTVNNH